MSVEELAHKSCVPCEEGVPPILPETQQELYEQLDHNWRIVERHHLTREFRFINFAEALAFVNQVSEIAEEENHHPDISFGWGKVAITLYTHRIDGLSESDFVFAAKIDELHGG